MKNKDKLQEIINLRLDGHTYTEIGKMYGVSRQRIQQLIAPPEQIATAVSKRANYKCEICGINLKHGGHLHHKTNGDYDYSSADNMMLVCASCHRRIHCIDKNPDLLTPRYCKYCGSVITRHNKNSNYCSIGCKIKDDSVTLRGKFRKN
jgi:predicted HNH restriction endonuclease